MPTSGGKRRFVAVLHVAGVVDTPAKAVQASLVPAAKKTRS
jgi:hypothetical protein